MEGGTECVVYYGGEVRSRIQGTTGIANVERVYFDKFSSKWKCGEKRQVCGVTVECTCPYPLTTGAPPAKSSQPEPCPPEASPGGTP